MRFESSVTSLSWIPSEAIKGLTRLPFDAGVTHYDVPPPDQLGDLDEMARADRYRFANELRAYIDVVDGRIADAGYLGGGHIGSTTVRLGRKAMVFQAVMFPDLQAAPDPGATSVRFVQTAGGRAGIPGPRRVRRKPFFQIAAPTVWSTLALTIHADGSSEFEVVGASPFPRHWIYDGDGQLVAKSGMTDFSEWYGKAFGKHTPWGDEESPALITVAETALERQLSATIMQSGKKPKIRKLVAGKVLVEQGSKGDCLYLLLDGVLSVTVDGQKIAELGPGALIGEHAILGDGTRTATLQAVTPVRVAVAAADQVEREALAELAGGHRREET
jgi:Cyclic nucleotide-binding domain